MITEIKVVDGFVLVKREIDGKLYRDGVLHPGADLTGKEQEIIDAATAAWTPEVIAAYEAAHPVVPPTPEQIAAEAQTIQDIADRDEVKAIPFVNFLANHTSAQIANRIENDILQDGVEQVLVRMGKALGYLCKKELR